MKSSIKGKLFGANLTPRNQNDPHLMIQLMIEDDECWYPFGTHFSSYWIDDLIETLTRAKEELASHPKDPSGYGRTL
jgi:hypothetical protein